MKAHSAFMSQFLLLCLLLAASTALELQVGIATSSETDADVLTWSEDDTEISDFVSGLNTTLADDDVTITIHREKLSYDDQTYPTEWEDVQVVVDLTQDFDLSQIFVFEALQNKIFHCVLKRPLSFRNSEMISDYTVFMTNSVVDVDNRLVLSMVKNFDWNRSIGIVKTSDLNMLKVARDFKNEAQNGGDADDEDDTDDSAIEIQGDIIIELGISSGDIDLITSRLKENLRLNNVRFIIIFADGETSANVIRAGFEILNGAGYSWIVAPEGRDFSSYFTGDGENGGLYSNGVLTFQEVEPFEDFKEEIEAVLIVAAKGYKEAVDSAEDDVDEDPLVGHGAAIKEYFIDYSGGDFSLDQDGARVVQYEILNTNETAENGVAVLGSWDSSTNAVTWNDTTENHGILWPGNKSEIPNDTIATVTLALLFPQTMDGEDYDVGTSVLNGAKMGIDDVNETSQIRSNYQFELKLVDTQNDTDPVMAAETVATLTYESFLGIIGPVSGDMTEAYLDYTKALEKTTIAIGADWPDLANTETYTSNEYYFLTMVQSVSAMSKAIVLYLSNNNWKDIAVIYTHNVDDASYSSQYGYLLSEAYAKNLDGGIKQTIRSTNSVPAGLTEDDMDKVNKVLRNVVRHKARIILFFGSAEDGLLVAREANKWKLWGEDYLWLGANWLPDNLADYLSTNHSDDKSTILEVLEGAVSVKVQPEVIDNSGSTVPVYDGEDFTNTYTENYGMAPLPEAYFAFDAVHVYAQAVQGMVSKGVDFANTDLLNTEIRSNIEFTGVTGNIKFRSSANDRLGVVQTFMNYQGNSKGMVAVSNFKIEGSHVFDPIAGVSAVYGELSSASPSGEIVDNGCSFDDRNVTYNVGGFAVVITLCLAILAITMVLAWISNKKWRSIPVKKIGRETEKTWKDWAIQIFIVVEFFQFLALAPLFLAQSDFLQRIIGLAMFDLLELIGKGADPKFFWISVNVVISFSFMWFLLVLLNMLNIESHLNRKPTLQKLLNTLTNLLLPLIGNTCFLPFTKLLVDIFVCYQTVFEGIDDYEHTFVERDCYMECWAGEHTVYVILGLFALFLYLPFAVFSRPLWEKAKVDVNIQLSTTYLLTKTCMQVFLIGLKRIVIDELAHSILFVLTFGAFIVFTYRRWPFNYDVINLWQLTLFCSILYYAFLSFLGMASDSRRELFWLILLLCGWAFGALGAFIIQKRKYKILLKTPKRKHTSLFARLDSKHRGNTIKSEQAKLVKGGAAPK